MTGRHAARTPFDVIRHRGGRAIADHNGDPSCAVCNWSPGPGDVVTHLERPLLSGGRLAAVSLIAQLHVNPLTARSGLSHWRPPGRHVLRVMRLVSGRPTSIIIPATTFRTD